MKSDVRFLLPTFLDELICSESAKVLELGTVSGHTTSNFLLGCEERQEGKVVTIDDMTVYKYLNYKLRESCLTNRWLFINNNEDITKVLHVLQHHQPFDLMFLDSTTHPEQTFGNLEMYSCVLRPAGKILLFGSHPGTSTFVIDAVRKFVVLNTDFQIERDDDRWGGLTKILRTS